MGSVGDFFGDVIDTGGDILGGVGDVIGDVAGGIGDLVGDLDLGDAVQAFIMSGGNPYAAAIAATGVDESLGFNPGSFMSGDFSSFGGGDLGGIGGGGFDLSVPDFGGLGDLGNFDISEVGSGFDLSNLGNLGENLGDIVDYGDYAQLGDAYNTSTSVLDNLGDLRDYGDYAQLGQDVTQGNIDYANQALNDYYNAGDYEQLGQIVTPGNIEAGNKAIQDYLNNPISTPGIGDTIRGGLDTAVEWYKKYGKMAGDVAKLVTSYEAGKLSKKQQEELNRKIQAEYDAYNAKKSAFQGQISSGQLPQLNISRGNYSPVVGYNPVYARGGSVRKKYGIGGIADILAGLNLPSLEEISGTYEKYKDPASDIFKLFTSYKAKELAEKQQKELNRKMQESYDKYNKDKFEFSNLISSGNLPKLNITKGSTPTVRMANGGIMGVIR
jgi:hypothetical protein